MPNIYFLVKRTIDIFVVFILSIFVLPTVLFAALLVLLEDRRWPFIRQERIGRFEKSFWLIKLRTMRIDRFLNGRKLSDDDRMLLTGSVFRKLSIDELPQLINVFKGDMSLIGPRPMPIIYLPYFKPGERIRHSVRPGMSGLAQVMGRNFLTWDQKFAYDVSYVKNLCFSLDIKIFFMTLIKLFLASDVGIRGKDIPVQSLHEIRQPWNTDDAI